MKNTELSKTTESTIKKFLKQNELQNWLKIFQGKSADDIISLKLSCSRAIDYYEIYKNIYTPISIILLVLLKLVKYYFRGNIQEIFYMIACVIWVAICGGVIISIFTFRNKAEESKKILNAIEILEKSGKLKKNPE